MQTTPHILPCVRQSVHPFTLTVGTVFLYSGKECTVLTAKPVYLFANQTGLVVETACGKTITFRLNSPRVQTIF